MPKKKPTPLESVMRSANDALQTGINAAGDAIRTGVEAAGKVVSATSEAVDSVLVPAATAAAEAAQQGMDAAFPDQARERQLRQSAARFEDWRRSGFSENGRWGQPLRIAAPDLPPGVNPTAPPEDIANAFARAMRQPLPINGPQDWPKVTEVQRVSDLPSDGRVSSQRPIAAYWPYMENLFGVDRQFLADLKKKENPFDVRGDSGAGARGPFQFIRGTWDNMMSRHADAQGLYTNMSPEDVWDLAEDPRWASAMAALHANENASTLRKAIGRSPTWGQVYLAHFSGVDRAAALIRADQSKPATEFYSRLEVSKNAPSFYPRLKGGGYDYSRPYTVQEHIQYHSSAFSDRVWGEPAN